jgi:uncharacterized protein YaiL (DUF2058 family)
MNNLIKTKTLPYHLQFFADPNPMPTADPKPASEPTKEPTTEPKDINPAPTIPAVEQPETTEPQLTPEEQVAQLMAKVKSLESKSDKSASDAAEWKKKYRETLDSKAQLDLEKAEREAAFQAEFESLKRENTINKMAKSFIGMGYSEDQAIKAATAQIDNDTDELFRIQQAFLTARDKAKEAEWMKKMPVPPAGNPGEIEDAFIKGFDKG